MPILGPEPVVAATVLTLKQGLNAAIDSVNAEHTDFQLDHVAADAVYPGGWSVLTYPCVEVAIADFETSTLALGNATFDLNAPIVVRGWVLDARADVGRLYFRALRMQAALMRTLIVKGAFGDNAQLDPDRPVRGAVRFDPENDERPEVEAACLLVFYLQTVEATL